MIAGRSWGCGLRFGGATGGSWGAGTGPCGAAQVVEASESMGISGHSHVAASLRRPLWVGENGVGAGGPSALNGASSRRVLSPQDVQQHRSQPLAAAQGTLHPAKAHPGNVVAAEAHPAAATEKQILR